VSGDRRQTIWRLPQSATCCDGQMNETIWRVVKHGICVMLDNTDSDSNLFFILYCLFMLVESAYIITAMLLQMLDAVGYIYAQEFKALYRHSR